MAQQSGNVDGKQSSAAEEALEKVTKELGYGVDATQRAAGDCRDVGAVEKENGPHLRAESGNLQGFDARLAPHPGGGPYGSRARKNTIAVAKTYEDVAYRYLEGESPPKAEIVGFRYRFACAVQACLACKQLEAEGNPPQCEAIRVLSQMRTEGEKAQTAPGDKPAGK